ncbi:MAG: hypothetical protein N2746_04590 [Deltaproteobacteria bacterium]|nr:hypothetical protein [Deltaproteobacteria bacterium]
MKYIVLMLLVTTCLYAQTNTITDEQVVQKVGHGQVNWTNKVIVVTGSAAPNLKGGITAAQVRLQTERAAELDAYRKILEIVKGVRVDSSWTIGDLMQSVPEVKTSVEGVIRGMKRIDTKYYSDGGVDVIVQVNLEGMMASTTAKEIVKKQEEKKGAVESVSNQQPKDSKDAKSDKSENQGITGYIINVKGHPYQPVMYPKIIDEKNNELFGVDKVDPSIVNEGKIVSYYLTENAAKNSDRVKDKPVVINAVSIRNKSEIVIKNEDAKKLDRDLLRNGRIAIIVD